MIAIHLYFVFQKWHRTSYHDNGVHIFVLISASPKPKWYKTTSTIQYFWSHIEIL